MRSFSLDNINNMIYTHFNSDLVPTAEQPFIEQLFACKNFEKSDRLLGYSKGRGITWFLNAQPELGRDIVLRHYYRGGLFGKFIKDQYWFHSFAQTRAAQEFNLLKQMHQWGLPVPQPIAFQIEKHHCYYRAEIMIEKIPNTQDLSKLLQQAPLPLAQYHQIGKVIRTMHDRQVCHTDLNIHNILLDEKGQCWLIDFDKCKIQPNDTWKKDNLNRLLRSFHKEQTRLGIHFNETDWQAICEGYGE